MSTVKTPIVRIGNSRGIRIPKVLIDQLGLGNEVEISVQRDRLIIRSSSRARYGWDELFRTMAERGDDRLLDEPLSTRWDMSDWTW
jgi:antitoxin MazE